MDVFIAANSICVRLIRLLLKGKFQAFYKYAKTFNSDDFDYTALENGDYIFMRWKVGTSCFFYYSFSFRIKRSTSALVALSGAVSSSWPHDQRHQRCFLCGLLLHLLPEVHSHHWGLLLPQKLRVVNVESERKSTRLSYFCCISDQPSFMLASFSLCRYQSLSLNHIGERSMSIYEFRWRTERTVHAALSFGGTEWMESSWNVLTLEVIKFSEMLEVDCKNERRDGNTQKTRRRKEKVQGEEYNSAAKLLEF